MKSKLTPKVIHIQIGYKKGRTYKSLRYGSACIHPTSPYTTHYHEV